MAAPLGEVERLQVELAAERARAAAAMAQARRAEDFTDRILHSRGWRLLDWARDYLVAGRQLRERLARVMHRLASRSRARPGPHVADPASSRARSARDYSEAVALDNERLLHEIPHAVREIFAFHEAPRISILMPVFNGREDHLRAAIESVRDQLYPHWELCIADDASTAPHVKAVLDDYSRRDGRIRVAYRKENGHISRATNTALGLATGDFVALLDHDDRLHPMALYNVACELRAYPDTDLVYTDEDKLDDAQQRSEPYFKCDFNYELLLSHNMICHLGVYRRSVALEIGGFRPGFEGAQDYDFVLRFLEQVGAQRIRHVPRVLYHWRVHSQSTAASTEAKPYAATAAKKALQEHIERVGLSGQLLPAEAAPGMNRVRFDVPHPQPTVDIIIPTRDRADLMEVVLETVFARTNYASFRVIVADNGSVEARTLHLFDKWKATGRVEVLRIDEPFNFSMLNNRAVASSQAEFICLLNNDIEVIDADWLREMVSHACRPGVGCVGARLWYPDGTLQHGGVVLGIGGVAGHAHKGWRRNDAGYFGRAVLLQCYSAVTAACLLVRRSIYDQVGGLDEQLQVAFNDVDFCMRVREAGYRNVWTPYAELVHHESISRGSENTPEKQLRFTREVEFMKRRWGRLLEADPMYSPNLTLEREDFSLRGLAA